MTLGARRGPGVVTVTTPWYPTPTQPMVGSYVAQQVRLTARIADRVEVVHAHEWAGGTAEVVAGLRVPFDAVLHAMAGTGGLVRSGAVGPVTRVPVLITSGMSVPDRAEALVRDAGIALGGRIDADVVHGHVGYLGGLLAARLASPGSRVFATEHSTGLRELLADPQGLAHYREVLERADRVLCVSRLLRDQLLDALPDYAERVGVLPNPVDIDAVPRREHHPEVLQRWLFSGGLVERKGVRRLVQAFTEVAGRDPEVTLTLMGEGPLRAELESIAGRAGVADRLTFTGALPHTQSLARMRDHDLLVAPSTYETFHLVVPEAVAAGLPVIVTRSGGPEEVLEGIEDHVGRFVDVSDDPAGIVDAYEDLSAHLGRLDLDGARDELRRRYGPEAVGLGLADLYGGKLRPQARPSPSIPRPVPPSVVVVATSGWRRDAVTEEAQAGIRLGSPVTVLTRDQQLADLLPAGVVRDPAAMPGKGTPSSSVKARRGPLGRARRLAGRGRRRLMGRRAPAAPPPASGELVTDATLMLGDAHSAPLVASLILERPDLQVCVELDRSGVLAPPPDAGRTEAAVGVAAHVVMTVANDISRDTRVRKSALAVAATGARVTVVGYAPDGRRHEMRLGPVTLLRVPVPFFLRDHARVERTRRRRLLAPGPMGSPAAERDRAVRTTLAVRERDLELLSGKRYRLLERRLAARRLATRARGLLGRKGERASTLGWRIVDKGLSRVTGGARWRRVLPEVDDYELAFGPVLDELAPDAIHAHDVHMVGVAARASARAAARGRRVPWVYDAHEWVAGLSQYGGRTARVVAAWSDLEQEYVRSAARIVTVSPPLAEALQRRYDLPTPPDVVRNIPPVGAAGRGTSDLRSTLGLADDVPLMVYSGGVQAARGVDTAVEALAMLREVHLAVVAVPTPHSTACQRLREQAVRLGVQERLHLLDPVAPDEVSAFLATADVGLIPLRHYDSHEMALANKLFEYLHAGVPAVVSDCRAQADFVREHRIGEIHIAGDAASLAEAVRRVLANPEIYRAALSDPQLQADHVWEHEAATLRDVYREILRLPPAQEPADAPGEGGRPEPPEEVPTTRPTCSDGVVLGIGPANSAGQAWAWARAAERHLQGVQSCVVAVRNGKYDYPSDVPVARTAFARDTTWQAAAAQAASATWTHALFEAGRPIFGTLNGRDFRGDADLLRRAGVRVGLALHGSEIRDPRQHAATHPWSPFADPAESRTKRLQHGCDELLPLVRSFDGPVFVSTPDQLDYVPGATWLPVVVDTNRWRPGPPVLERPVPLVVHAPSTPWLKGTDQVLATLQPLADAGKIELRLVTGMPPAQAAELIRSADVVVDQVLLGLYGVLACEAMSAGRLVLGNVGERLRSRVPADLPVIEVTPANLSETLDRFLQDPVAAREVAAEGPAFVERFHDGRYSSEVLAEFLTTT